MVKEERLKHRVYKPFTNRPQKWLPQKNSIPAILVIIKTGKEFLQADECTWHIAHSRKEYHINWAKKRWSVNGGGYSHFWDRTKWPQHTGKGCI
jgi:hypothetical protein